MPELLPYGNEEWAITQLRMTANLKFENPVAQILDFLMFHGDSFQVEHHLWPAMSFVNFRQASKIVKATCKEFGVPYHEVGYWEGYYKIWSQVYIHASLEPSKKRSAREALPDCCEDIVAKVPRRFDSAAISAHLD